MNDWMKRLREAWSALQPRERWLVGSVVALSACLIIAFGIIRPTLAAQSRQASRVDTARQELEVVRGLRDQFDAVNGRLRSVEERIASAPRGEIFTTLEQLAGQSQVTVDAMEPRSAPASDDYRETKVQVTLKGQTLAQVVRYLHGIENAKQPLSIKSLRVRTRADKPELLDVTFTVSSFEPITGGSNTG